VGVRDLANYPWDAVEPYRERAASHPDGLVDLSIGSPVDPTPTVIRTALAEATDAHSYPQTVGTPALREAIVDWYARRRGVPDLTTANVLPTIGSKELVALLPTLLDLGEGDIVVHPRVAYPTYAVGATVAGATAVAADDPADWHEGTRLVWINSPGNPDGRTWTVDELAAAVRRARELGAVLASDECYAELGWDGPWASESIPSVLDPRVTGGTRSGLLSVYSLSKQSNLAGYRAAFVAGDPTLVRQLLEVRKHAGMIVPWPVQRALLAAVRDDEHVAAQRERYRARREVLRPALEGFGMRIDDSGAGLYLWATAGEPCRVTVDRLADLGILVAPGDFYGAAGAQHVRVALSASDERIAAAAARLSS
jgi:succinyldiaminopimelate transaminase